MITRDTIEHVPSATPDPNQERIAQLRDLFPEAFIEGKVDFDKLRATLGDLVDGRPERYSFTWAGKRDAIRLVQIPSSSTLIPAPEESINWDVTQNLFIEGDNLEVLKLLYKSYFGQIKMIYIDPPYNTGSDRIYPDNYSDPIEPYLRLTGQRDSEGNILTSNPESGGRFHSAWLSMMYPRLFVARRLLRADGIILISMDDREVYNLRQVMNEIFGEENFLAELVWDLGTGTQAGHFTRSHEYIIVYARDKSSLPNFSSIEGGTITDRAIKKISRANPASDIEFPVGIDYAGDDLVLTGEFGGTEKVTVLSDQLVFENGKLRYPVMLRAGWAMKNQILSWLAGKETFDSKGQQVVRFYFNRQGILWYEKERGTFNPRTVISGVGSTKQGSSEVEALFGAKVMDFPKPVKLIKFLTEAVCDERDIILDFFAGSCTTAQAVLELNHHNALELQFICVQLPEPTPPDSVAHNAGHLTIAEIGKERIRRVISMIENDKSIGSTSSRDTQEDLGFRVFKLAVSNIMRWNVPANLSPPEYESQLALFTDQLQHTWTPASLIWEVAIKEGFSLSSTIRRADEVASNSIVVVTDTDKGQSLYICLDDSVDVNGLRPLNLNQDVTFICRDTALTDSAAANLALQCRLRVI